MFIWGLVIFATLLFSVLRGVLYFGYTIFGLLDSLTTNVLLLLAALLIVLFLGWYVKAELEQEELELGGYSNPKIFKVVYFMVRYIALIALILIFLNSFGLFS